MNKNLKCCHEIVRGSKSQNTIFTVSNTASIAAQDSYKQKLARMMHSSGWSVWSIGLGCRRLYQLQDCEQVTNKKTETGDNWGRSAVTMYVAPDTATRRQKFTGYKNCKTLKPRGFKVSGNRLRGTVSRPNPGTPFLRDLCKPVVLVKGIQGVKYAFWQKVANSPS